MVRQELTLDPFFVADPQPNAVADHLRLGHHGMRTITLHALPTLPGLSVPAAVFVTTGLIDRDRRIIRRFSRLWRASAMT
jgi:hypothetical protein